MLATVQQFICVCYEPFTVLDDFNVTFAYVRYVIVGFRSRHRLYNHDMAGNSTSEQQHWRFVNFGLLKLI